MNLFIEPLDVLLFRKSQPFTAGEGGRAAGAFPPTVVPFQGAIRTTMLAKLGLPFERYCSESAPPEPSVGNARALLGHPRISGDLGRLRIRGPHLARETTPGCYEILFPAPRNALWEKETGHGRLRALAPETASSNDSAVVGGGSGFPADFRLLWDVDADKPGTSSQGLWLTARALRAHLSGLDIRDEEPVPEESLFIVERRSGIERDRATKTAAAGKLYGVDFVRTLPKVGFFMTVNLDGDDGEELLSLVDREGFMSLGGERRAAHYRSLEDGDIADYKSLLTPSPLLGTEFLLYYATPAVFRPDYPGHAGWVPSWIDERTLVATGGPAPGLRVASAALGKPIPIGGWDFAKRQPKPLHWAVPAGSVYYCRTESSGAACIEALHGMTISEFLPDAGMGQVLVGRWPHAD